MHVAAQLTQAACAGSGAAVPIDPDLKDNAVRAKNLQVWETFRVFYHAVVGALAESKDWQPPKGTIVGDLGKLLAGPGSLIEVLQKLIGVIPMPPVLPSTPLPNPGTSK